MANTNWASSPIEDLLQNGNDLITQRIQAQQQAAQQQAALSSQQPQKSGNLLQNILGGLYNTTINPVVQTVGKTIPGGVYEGARALLTPFTNQIQGQASKDQAAGNNNTIADFLANFQTSKNPFLSQGGAFTNVAGKPNYTLEDVNNNPVGALTNQVKSSAEIAALGVPFGGASIAGKTLPFASNFIGKTVLPGALVGALQSFGQGDNPTQIAENAGLGAGGASVLQGLLNIPGIVGKFGQGIEDTGSNIRQDVSKITLNPSVYGASREKEVQNVLNDLNITGSAQAKYEKLLPTMQNLGDKIEEELTSNPVNVPISQLKQDFLANLKDQMRTSDLNSTQAKEEISGYLADLADAVQTDTVRVPLKNGSTTQIFNNENVSSPDLFKLKLLANQDYQTIAKKLENGTPLTPREQVISVARKTLDDTIAETNPLVKKLTTQQSALFDAAPSLEAARRAGSNVAPLGIPIPPRVIQATQDSLGNVIQKTGQGLSVGNPLSSLLGGVPASLVGQVGARGAEQLGNQITNPTQNQNNNPVTGGNNNQNGENIYGQGNQLASILSQGATSNGAQRITPQMLQAAELGAPQFAPALEKAYQAQFLGPYGQPISPDQISNIQQANQAQGVLSQINQLLPTLEGRGRIAGNIEQILSGAGLAPNVKAYNDYRDTIAIPLIRSLGDKGQVPSKLIDRAVDTLPSVTDTPQEARLKLQNLNQFFQMAIANIQNISGNQTTPANPYATLFGQLGVQQ